MHLRFDLRSTLAWGLLSVACLGCGGGGPVTHPVTGTVTYHGQPVVGAQVMFTSDAGRAAEGTTDAEGKFTLTTFKPGDGALAGVHHVTVVKMETIPSKDPNNPYGAGAKSVLPARYANPKESPLQETVGAAKNEFNFVLTDK